MQPNQNLEDAIEKMRSEIILTNAKSQQSALNSFDVMVNQLRNYNKVAIDLKNEITRLQELCDKNKIDYKQKPPQTKPIEVKPQEVKTK